MYSYQAKLYNEVLGFEGVLHDVALSEEGLEIAVSSGKMPSYTVLYNKTGEPYFLLAHDFRNRVFFSPNKEFLAVCGFSSLNGDIEIWNYKELKLIAKAKSSYASFLKWSSSSKFFMTATVVDKLKVDHKICLYTFDGISVKKLKLEVCDLINVDFATSCPPEKNLKSKRVDKGKGGGGLLGVNKRKPGKITFEEIKQINVRIKAGIKDEAPAPSLEVGEKKGRFFNSKKGGKPNKFKRNPHK